MLRASLVPFHLCHLFLSVHQPSVSTPSLSSLSRDKDRLTKDMGVIFYQAYGSCFSPLWLLIDYIPGSCIFSRPFPPSSLLGAIQYLG